jgi:hypothetical protein
LDILSFITANSEGIRLSNKSCQKALPSIKHHVFINNLHSAVKLQSFSLAYKLKMTTFETNLRKPNFALNSQNEYAEETENTNLRGQQAGYENTFFYS